MEVFDFNTEAITEVQNHYKMRVHEFIKRTIVDKLIGNDNCIYNYMNKAAFGVYKLYTNNKNDVVQQRKTIQSIITLLDMPLTITSELKVVSNESSKNLVFINGLKCNCCSSLVNISWNDFKLGYTCLYCRDHRFGRILSWNEFLVLVVLDENYFWPEGVEKRVFIKDPRTRRNAHSYGKGHSYADIHITHGDVGTILHGSFVMGKIRHGIILECDSDLHRSSTSDYFHLPAALEQKRDMLRIWMCIKHHMYKYHIFLLIVSFIFAYGSEIVRTSSLSCLVVDTDVRKKWLEEYKSFFGFGQGSATTYGNLYKIFQMDS